MNKRILLVLEKVILAFIVIYVNYYIGDLLFFTTLETFNQVVENMPALTEDQIIEKKYFFFSILGIILLGLMSCAIWATVSIMRRKKSFLVYKNIEKKPKDKNLKSIKTKNLE